MTKETVKFLRKGWASLMAWVNAVDYSIVDYTTDRIRELEREMKLLMDEIMETRMPGEAAKGGFHPSAPAHET